MNVAVSAQDERAIEVLASGLPIHGAQPAVGVTMRCALTAQGLASPGAAHINGAAALRARRDKELKYQELVSWQSLCSGCRGSRDGGRWSSEAVDFVSSGRSPGTGTSVASPFFVLGLASPLVRMLAVSCGRAFASSLVTSCSVTPEGQDGPPPDLADLLA